MYTGGDLAEWLSARAGKLTASRAQDAFAKLKRGGWAKARYDYQRELLAERMTGENIRHYVTDAMRWGIEQEEEVKAMYEVETGSLVRPTGFFDHPWIENCGATPDGLLGTDGLIEIKAPTTNTFVEWRLGGVIPDERRPQLLLQLACTGRKWVEFVAGDPRVKNPAHRLFICRFVPAEGEIEAVEVAAVEFLQEVDALWERLHS